MRYWIRQHRKHVSGPHEVEAVQAWIREGRVRPDMEFSTDRRDWALGFELPELFPDVWRTESRRNRRRGRGRLSHA